MTHDEWYARLKAQQTITLHPSDFTAALESALRRRAKRDGFGLSTTVLGDAEDVAGIERVVCVALFPKGARRLGREKFFKT